MDELSRSLRARVLETLELIASQERQRKYQRDAPRVDVAAELFNQWEDCFFPEDDNLRRGFEAKEWIALSHFDEVLNQVGEETPQALPALEEFMQTAAWRKLSEAARAALAVVIR